jgi:hypothetical protein
MAINYVNSIKQARMQIVANNLNLGKLDIYNAGYLSLLVSIVLQNPSAVVSGGILQILGVPISSEAIGTGNAVIANFVDSVNNPVAEGLTVGMSAANIIIDKTNISSGQIVNLTSGIIIHG